MGSVGHYGRFHEKQGLFELTAEPPRKWRNTHYTDCGEMEMYSEVSNIGDGFCRLRDNDGNSCLLVGYDAKYCYIRDEQSGVAFNPWGEPLPTPTLDKSCKFYPEKTVISGTAAGLRATQTVFVPRHVPVEVWTVELENLEEQSRVVSVFGYALFQLTGCDKEGRTVGKDNSSELLPRVGAVLVSNRDHRVPAPFFNGYIMALGGYRAATGYRDYFTRTDYSHATPRLLFGEDLNNRAGVGPDCCGAVQVTRTIPARGTVRVDFILGGCRDSTELEQFSLTLSSEIIDVWREEAASVEKQRREMFSIDIGEPNRDRAHLVNLFAKKQAYSYLIDKSGFRDSMQIATAVAMFDYPTARATALRALSSQQECGAVIHGFRPLNRLIYADKPAWMLMTIPWLIKESGDLELLRQNVPWFESQKSATVWEHLQRAYRYLANDTGKHGLCNQHFADWNDQLEPTEKTGERESVMVSQQLCMGLLEVEQLALYIGDEAVGQECKELHAKMAATINDVAWDGGWYQRTICEDGHRLGSRANAEAQIFLNTQSWAILGGVADEQRAQSCMQSVDRLIEQPFGFVICHPPLSSYDDRIGKYCHVRPGVSENGGAYCHAAGFKLVADCMLGRAEEAWRTFVKVAPDNPVNPISNSGIEPFSFTNCYSTVEPVMGKAGYPWRTGTAGWFTMGIVEWILGVRRHYDGLLIDPCLSASIQTASVRRTYRGATYHITIDNRAGLCRGTRKIELDGESIDGKLLPVGKKGREYRVKVLI